MSRDALVLGGLGLLALLALVLAVTLAVALTRTRARTHRELAEARAETAGLRLQLDQIERVLAGSFGAPGPQAAAHDRAPRQDVEYTITGLGREEPPAPAPAVDRALFADLVLRETVVKVASLAHGVRRALGPASRNRIRFEMRQEVRRARKQRRADTRDAVREWEARQRAAMTDGAGAA